MIVAKLVTAGLEVRGQKVSGDDPKHSKLACIRHSFVLGIKCQITSHQPLYSIVVLL